jgi:hypothetical protein
LLDLPAHARFRLSARFRGVGPYWSTPTGFPRGSSGDRGAFRGDVELPARVARCPQSRVCSRPRFLASPSARKVGPGVAHLSLDFCKTPDRRSRCRPRGLHPLSGSGKVPGASARVSARAVARPAPRAPGFSDFLAFSRLGHACEDCRHSARWVGPLRHGLVAVGALPPTVSEGTRGVAEGASSRVFPGPCIAPAQVSLSFSLPDQQLSGWEESCSTALRRRSPRKGSASPGRFAAPSLSLGSPGVRFLRFRYFLRPDRSVACMDGSCWPRKPRSRDPLVGSGISHCPGVLSGPVRRSPAGT